MMLDQVRSKPWMGLFGNVSAIMATCAAFGLAMYLGIPFIGINLAAPFLMIGESVIFLTLMNTTREFSALKMTNLCI